VNESKSVWNSSSRQHILYLETSFSRLFTTSFIFVRVELLTALLEYFDLVAENARMILFQHAH